MRIALAGTGAFGTKHLDGLANIDGVTVKAVVSRRLEQAEEVARKYGVEHAGTDLNEVLARDDVDAVILCTPTQLHASQAIEAMRAGKHVQVEIPVADSWTDAQEVQRVQRETGLTCMVGHTRRFNPSHQWVRRRIVAGELSIQQMDVQTLPDGVRNWMDMSIAMPSSAWIGPCTAWAIWVCSPVWYWNRSTVCAA